MKPFGCVVLYCTLSYAQQTPATSVSTPETVKPPTFRTESVLYKASVGSYLAAGVADTWSSWNRREANPFLAQSGRFSSQSAAIKCGITGGVLLAEWLILRHHPSMRHPFTWLNFGAAGVTAGTAVRNSRLPR